MVIDDRNIALHKPYAFLLCMEMNGGLLYFPFKMKKTTYVPTQDIPFPELVPFPL
jgi:hypothetical protein